MRGPRGGCSCAGPRGWREARPSWGRPRCSPDRRPAGPMWRGCCAGRRGACPGAGDRLCAPCPARRGDDRRRPRETTYRDHDLARPLLPRRPATRGSRVLTSRSAEISQGPGRRQHRHLRVRQPGQARHGHDPHELHPVRSTRPAARTSTSSATTSSTRSTSTTTATPRPDVTYQFEFQARAPRNEDTFLYNTGPITATLQRRPGTSGSSTPSRRSSTVPPPRHHADDHDRGRTRVLPSPPCNIGRGRRRTTRRWPQAAVHDLPSGETVFAGQRNEGFFVDLGSIFVFGDLRPLPEPAPHRHLAGDGRGRDCLGSLDVDDCFKLCCRLHWEVGGLITAQNPIDIERRHAKHVVLVGSEGHETAGQLQIN